MGRHRRERADRHRPGRRRQLGQHRVLGRRQPRLEGGAAQVGADPRRMRAKGGHPAGAGRSPTVRRLGRSTAPAAPSAACSTGAARPVARASGAPSRDRQGPSRRPARAAAAASRRRGRSRCRRRGRRPRRTATPRPATDGRLAALRGSRPAPSGRRARTADRRRSAAGRSSRRNSPRRAVEGWRRFGAFRFLEMADRTKRWPAGEERRARASAFWTRFFGPVRFARSGAEARRRASEAGDDRRHWMDRAALGPEGPEGRRCGLAAPGPIVLPEPGTRPTADEKRRRALNLPEFAGESPDKPTNATFERRRFPLDGWASGNRDR